jgi:hypothetical protein
MEVSANGSKPKTACAISAKHSFCLASDRSSKSGAAEFRISKR